MIAGVSEMGSSICRVELSWAEVATYIYDETCTEVAAISLATARVGVTCRLRGGPLHGNKEAL